jgi:uncharacterized protein
MPNNYKIPGVYIKEVSTLPSNIVRESQTIPLFIGLTPNHTKNFPVPTGAGEVAQAVTVNSYLEYVQIFGGPKPESFSVTIADVKEGNDVRRSIAVARVLSSDSDFIFTYAIQNYFANGGGPCKILSIGLAYTTWQSITNYWHNGARIHAPTIEGCSLILLPDAVNLKMDVNDNRAIDVAYAALMVDFLKICETHGNRFLLMDVPMKASSNIQSATAASLASFRKIVGGTYLRHGAAYFPYLVTTLRYAYDLSSITVTHSVDGNLTGAMHGKKVSELKLSGFDAVYGQIVDRIEATPVVLPPSSAVAGQMVRTDRDRGVWKATANVSLNGLQGPSLQLTTQEEEACNVDPAAGKSVNVIRNFPGRGTLIWGARTLDGNSNEWRYIPVRRLFTMAEAAIKRGSEWAVFEPNDSNTWLRLKSMIENYLTGLWREGALVGGKPQEAFYVRVGLGTTMTQQDILEGLLRIEIGMAAVRPAEFIVLRVSQMMQQS